MAVEKGFNSDLVVDGENLHLQTEDWGKENPFIVSRIYASGAVVKSIKTSYEEFMSQEENVPSQETLAIRQALRNQHNEILDQLISGKLLI